MKHKTPQIPSIVSSPSPPAEMQALWEKEQKEKLAQKKQRQHDYLIATYGIIGGIISGIASSIIVLWLQGLL